MKSYCRSFYARCAFSHITKETYRTENNVLFVAYLYYPPEVSSMKYCCLGVFRNEYMNTSGSSLSSANKKKWTKILGSKRKKHLRGSTQATIHPLAIILTPALWALVIIIA